MWGRIEAMAQSIEHQLRRRQVLLVAVCGVALLAFAVLVYIAVLPIIALSGI